nr:glycogen synthase GlgA [Novosphingobium profundi]
MPDIRVLSVASEAVPLVKTGGLADVVGALPGALADEGVAVTTLLPGYPSVLKALGRARAVHTWPDLFGGPARLLTGKLGAHPLYVLDAPDLFTREGLPYADAAGKDWPDNWRRFCALGRAAADVAGGAVVLRGKAQRFDLLHAHDWQGAMAAAYTRYAPFGGAAVPSVVTVHNIAFQGRFEAAIFAETGLPSRAWHMQGVEYYGGFGMLKAGLFCADAITTVSPTYAREIRSPRFGMGLEGLIAERGSAVHGILNGIDGELWNPAHDASLAATYTARTLGRKALNTRALEAEFGLVEEESPLFVAITRLTWQKGMDLLPEMADHLVAQGARLAVLGSGDADLEAQLRAVAARHPGRVAVRIGYDEALSHRMQAGGDAILIPSRFEPCGLTQLYGLAYGCVPVVARTGGLADTVIDANPAALAAGVATGIQFDGVDAQNVAAAIERTVALYGQKDDWQRLQKNGMKADFSWGASGRAYARLYRDLIG